MARSLKMRPGLLFLPLVAAWNRLVVNFLTEGFAATRICASIPFCALDFFRAAWGGGECSKS